MGVPQLGMVEQFWERGSCRTRGQHRPGTVTSPTNTYFCSCVFSTQCRTGSSHSNLNTFRREDSKFCLISGTNPAGAYSTLIPKAHEVRINHKHPLSLPTAAETPTFLVLPQQCSVLTKHTPSAARGLQHQPGRNSTATSTGVCLRDQKLPAGPGWVTTLPLCSNSNSMNENC